jgi:hypothetical protein
MSRKFEGVAEPTSSVWIVLATSEDEPHTALVVGHRTPIRTATAAVSALVRLGAS